MCACALGMATPEARAQGDGPRAYAAVPEGTNVFSVYGQFLRGNTLLDTSQVIRGGDIDIDVAVLFYAHPISPFGRSGGLFVVQPMGAVSGSLQLLNGVRTGSSNGLGDTQLGAVVNLVGLKSVPVEEFIKLKPGFMLGALAKVTLPTGSYDSDRLLNLGANRTQVWVGLPFGWNIGKSYLDPHLTSIEVVPQLVFSGDNTDAAGSAQTLEQAPMLRVETHIIRNLNRAVWVSADIGGILGGETTSDGVANDNTQKALTLGGTVNVMLSRHFGIKTTYGQVVARDDGGPDGSMFRVIGSVFF
jgi:hypothetical protein